MITCLCDLAAWRHGDKRSSKFFRFELVMLILSTIDVV
jgi:hypothetical protein